MPGESAQRLERIIEAGHQVALTVEDDLQDLACCRRGVQHDGSQLPCHARFSFLHRACLCSAAVRDLRSEHSMPPSCAPHERSPGTRAYSRLAHDVWL